MKTAFVKSLLLGSVLSMSLASSSFAASKFACSGVGGTEEWTIYVDLDKNIAGFFDNDSTVTVPLTRVVSLESRPPQWLYTFQGEDTQSEGNLRISFNKTRLSASVTFDVDSDNARTEKADNGCVEYPNLDLE